MIRKMDTSRQRKPLFADILVTPVYYSKRRPWEVRHEHRRRDALEDGADDVRAVAARAREAGRRDERHDLVDRAESCESVRELAEEGAGRHSHVARRVLHARSQFDAAGVLRAR